MASISHLGHLPFCIPEVAQDGKPFQVWDQVTLFGKNKPSKSASEDITVYGSGTEYFIGLTLEELMLFYWKAKTYKLSFANKFTFTTPQVSVTTGYWDTSVDPPEWVSTPRYAAPINFVYDGTQLSDTFTEQYSICADPARFPYFNLSVVEFEESTDEEDPTEAYSYVELSLDVFGLHMAAIAGLGNLDYFGVIKGQDGLYYISLGDLGFSTFFGMYGKIYTYGANFTPTSYPDYSVDVIYDNSFLNPKTFGYELNPSIDNETLSEHILRFHIDFPSGRKTYTTKLWGGDNLDTPPPIPELVLTFEEFVDFS